MQRDDDFMEFKSNRCGAMKPVVMQTMRMVRIETAILLLHARFIYLSISFKSNDRLTANIINYYSIIRSEDNCKAINPYQSVSKGARKCKVYRKTLHAGLCASIDAFD